MIKLVIVLHMSIIKKQIIKGPASMYSPFCGAAAKSQFLVLPFILAVRASKRNFARQSKTALGPLGAG